jgi:D-alanyl-D-alanine carboxypeptidase
VTRIVFIMLLLFVWAGCLDRHQAHASEGRYASIIVDADALDILHARQIDAQRHPASLTKIMTLHLVFEAVDRGQISFDTELMVSRNAARTPPVKMGLRAGQRVSVDTLVQAVAVRSSNDAAVVLAEGLAGSEAAFAARMTDKARSLGMRQTVFRNATGLPNEDQVTTARDMAKLAHATLRTFPQHYHYFGQPSFRGRKSTNALLSRPDVDGFKTGYTRASGYNLVISATRSVDGKPRRIIAVILGGASTDSRNAHMVELIDRGFDVLHKTSRPIQVVRSTAPATVHLAKSQTRAGHWAIEIGGFQSAAAAEIAAGHLVKSAGQGEVKPRSGFASGQAVFMARVEGLGQMEAKSLCANHADILALPARRCRVLSITQ